MYRIMLNQVSQRVKGSVGDVRNVFKKKSCGASPCKGEIINVMGATKESVIAGLQKALSVD